MPDPHPLDRPAWNALTTGWAKVAQGGAGAWRLDPDYGPFGAAADGSDESLVALAALVPAGGMLWTPDVCPLPVPPGIAVVSAAECEQMVASDVPEPDAAFAFEELTDADVPAMRALVALTEPGPFARRTNRLGRFVGVKRDGALVAMAGERMQMPGFTEVSGVCTHPDHRGGGLAARLMMVVSRRMLARGETPFLHAYAANRGAITLYERLGFRTRAIVTATVLRHI